LAADRFTALDDAASRDGIDTDAVALLGAPKSDEREKICGFGSLWR
jgi:hypothetical protein